MILKETILLGYSGHALVVANCLTNGHEITGYFDQKENASNPLDISYLGNENDFHFSTSEEGNYYFPAVGDNSLRKKMRDFLLLKQLHETTAIHSTSYIAENANIGQSSMIGPKAIVNDFAQIGNGVIVNSGAIIEHECKIDDYVHIAPGAVIAGNVTIGELSFVGANSVVKEGVKIGKNVIIGAGSVVLVNIPDNELWAGSPASKKK